MAIRYDKLFPLMKERGYSTYKIVKEGILSANTLQRFRENKPASTVTINNICRVLDCQPGDFMEYKPDQKGMND